MNRSLVLDLVVLTAVVGASLRGWARGSVREAFALVGFIAALVLVVGLTGLLAHVVEISGFEHDPAVAISAAILFASGVIAGVILGVRVARDTPIPGPRWLDSVGGSSFAFVRTLALVALVLFCLDTAWGPESVGHRMIADSVSGEFLTGRDSPFGTFYTFLERRSDALASLSEWASRDDEKRDVGFITRELRPTDARLTVQRNAERDMLQEINSDRRGRGLEPFRWCEACAEVARSHSKDMYRGGYFSHVDLDGDDPFDRMKEAGISYGAAGENLALAPTVTEAHAGLMKSPKHRANILRLAFDEVGIGIYEGPFGLMCTQVFRALP